MFYNCPSSLLVIVLILLVPIFVWGIVSQRKVCNSIVGEKNGEFALKIDSGQLSEQEQEQEYLTNLVYENNSLTGERERERERE